MKMVYETRKMLEDDSIQICPTCVRVPVSNCHSESILVETERKITVEEARRLFAATPGLVVMDDLEKKVYPMPINGDQPRRDVHRPDSRGPFLPERPGVLVRQRQSPQGRGHQRRADCGVAGERGRGVGQGIGGEGSESVGAAVQLPP